MTDPIADMLTRIRNAVHSRHQRVDVPASRFKAEIARILEQEGYIQGFKMVDASEAADGARAPCSRSCASRSSTARAARTSSRASSASAGRAAACISGREDVPKVLGGLGTSILTTSRGVMTGREAIKAGVGGEVLCNIW